MSGAPNAPTDLITTPHAESQLGNNNTQGILRLHDELLAEISLQYTLLPLYTEVTQPHAFVLAEATCHYEWIGISHISRRWRQIVLTTPRIWATIALPSNITWIETLLKRSGQAPLTVVEDIAEVTPERTAARELVLREVHRIRRLAIVIDPPSALAILPGLTSPERGAPLLEALDIKILYTAAYPTTHLPMPSHDSLPRIQHLSYDHDLNRLNEMRTPVPDLALIRPLAQPTLTSLYIHELETPVRPEDILGMLRTLPNLEELVLGIVLLASSSNPVNHLHAGPPVHLPHLQKMEFRGSCHWWSPSPGEDEDDEYDHGMAAADVLRHLAIPTSATIFFSAGENYLEGTPLGFMCGVLADAVAGRSVTSIGPPREPISECRLHLSSPDVVNTFVCELELLSVGPLNGAHNIETVYGRYVDPAEYGANAQSCPLAVNISTNYYAFTPCVCYLLRSFAGSLSSVATLQIVGHVEDPIHSDEEEDYMDDLWRAIQETMPEVRELKILGHSREFVRWLGGDLEGVEGIMFSALQTLEVDGSEWDLSEDGNEQADPGEEHEDGEEDEDKSICGQIIEALQGWSGQFDGQRKLGRLTVLNADKAVREDLDKIKASGFVDAVEAVYTWKFYPVIDKRVII